MNIALIGYGKMGKEIEQLAPKRNITIKQIFTSQNNYAGIGLTKASLKGIDVCIDFSTPTAVIANITAVAKCGKNIVVGTTGWYDKLVEVKKIVKDKKIGLVYSPNFSLGMNIFQQILTAATYSIGKFDLYDVAITEMHHREKKDSPSGTALALGQIILQNMPFKSCIFSETAHSELAIDRLHITSTRVGSVIGNHRVIFDSEADSIELVHSSKNRQGFALGALVAAEWIKNKKGLFTMKDVLLSR